MWKVTLTDNFDYDKFLLNEKLRQYAIMRSIATNSLLQYPNPGSTFMKGTDNSANIKMIEDHREETELAFDKESRTLYCEVCKRPAINTTRIECCDIAKRSIY